MSWLDDDNVISGGHPDPAMVRHILMFGCIGTDEEVRVYHGTYADRYEGSRLRNRPQQARVSYPCGHGHHEACTKSNCTCDCGHPTK